MTDRTRTHVAHAKYPRITQVAPGVVHLRSWRGNNWSTPTRVARRRDTLAVTAEDSVDDDFPGTLDREELMPSAVLGAYIGDGVALVT